MNDETKVLLDGVVNKNLEELEDFEFGSEAYNEATKQVVNLMDRQIKLLEIEAEKECKMAQIEVEKKDSKTKNIINGVVGILGVGVQIGGLVTLIILDATDKIPLSNVGKSFAGKIFNKK